MNAKAGLPETFADTQSVEIDLEEATITGRRRSPLDHPHVSFILRERAKSYAIRQKRAEEAEAGAENSATVTEPA